MSEHNTLIEEGVVVVADGPLATVRVERRGACGTSGSAPCGDGCSCSLGGENKTLLVRAINRAAAHEGERVKLSMQSSQVLGMAALAYLLPLVLLFIGALSGPVVFQALGLTFTGDPARAVAAIAGLVLGIGLLKLIFLRVKPGSILTPIIVEVVH